MPLHHPISWYPCSGPYRPEDGESVLILYPDGFIQPLTMNASDKWEVFWPDDERPLDFTPEALATLHWARPLPVQVDRKARTLRAKWHQMGGEFSGDYLHNQEGDIK